MELSDLLGTPNSELSPEQLEEKLRQLKKLAFKKPITNVSKPKKQGATKSNKDKQLSNLISGMNEDAKKKLMEALKGI